MPALAVRPASVRPGDAFLVEARGVAAPPLGAVAGRPLEFYPVSGGYEAIAALPLETPPGTLAVEVRAPSATDPQARLAAPLEVVEPRFPARTLSVEPRFVEPAPEVRARMEEDKAAIARATAVPFSPPLFDAPFAWPRPPSFTGRYGDQRVYNGKLASQHYGLDFRGAPGDPVRAGNAGRVVLRRDCYASGLTVILSHGAGLFTSYFHLSKALVQEGERVERGALLGAVGASGRATGPHLHYSVRVGDLFVDPESVMRLPFVPREAR
ncbi:M23 family metallopeptidase [Anaeromyxobacter paludicola]|uniref:Peptidase n=1 Tax=Anaeromyxobacter paludicola TaxID=2918171 RepID=A0ABM7XFJ3_9BACT|nr:M23 family metallopeptidase [Anaeromyxobacter paludicola]BDG10592.1 peptidase [Anaeromyxobacter paludicola]